VKLLFDENLSPRLVELLREHYSDSEQVRRARMGGATDRQVWDFAIQGNFVIVSKDDDFRQRSFLEGAPPKVVWLQVGNAGTQAIAELLVRDKQRIRDFAEEEESALLILRAAV